MSPHRHPSNTGQAPCTAERDLHKDFSPVGGHAHLGLPRSLSRQIPIYKIPARAERQHLRKYAERERARGFGSWCGWVQRELEMGNEFFLDASPVGPWNQLIDEGFRLQNENFHEFPPRRERSVGPLGSGETERRQILGNTKLSKSPTESSLITKKGNRRKQSPKEPTQAYNSPLKILLEEEATFTDSNLYFLQEEKY